MPMRSAPQSTDGVRGLRVPCVGKSPDPCPVSADDTTDTAVLFVLVVGTGRLQRTMNEDHFVAVVGVTGCRDSRAEFAGMLCAIERRDFAGGDLHLGNQG